MRIAPYSVFALGVFLFAAIALANGPKSAPKPNLIELAESLARHEGPYLYAEANQQFLAELARLSPGEQKRAIVALQANIRRSNHVTEMVKNYHSNGMSVSFTQISPEYQQLMRNWAKAEVRQAERKILLLSYVSFDVGVDYIDSIFTHIDKLVPGLKKDFSYDAVSREIRSMLAQVYQAAPGRVRDSVEEFLGGALKHKKGVEIVAELLVKDYSHILNQQSELLAFRPDGPYRYMIPRQQEELGTRRMIVEGILFELLSPENRPPGFFKRVPYLPLYPEKMRKHFAKQLIKEAEKYSLPISSKRKLLQRGFIPGDCERLLLGP